MNNISIEELEQKIESGEEVIDRYFDPTTTRVGKPYAVISRRKSEMVMTSLELPAVMLAELDRMAEKLEMSRNAMIKMILRRSLDEYLLAKEVCE